MKSRTSLNPTTTSEESCHSWQDALYVLERIHNDRAPIKNTLGAFIVFMIEKLENTSSSSSSPRSVWTASSSPEGETSNPLPATLCNGQSLCSSLSPYEIMSAPSDAYRQICERFQGQT